MQNEFVPATSAQIHEMQRKIDSFLISKVDKSLLDTVAKRMTIENTSIHVDPIVVAQAFVNLNFALMEIILRKDQKSNELKNSQT